jgi:hypothetical protein
MFIFLLMLAILVADIFLILAQQANSPARKARRAAAEANELLTKAEGKLLLNQNSEAAALFRQALYKAEVSEPLLASEAFYGLARVAERSADKAEAVRMTEQALELAKFWRAAKPNFETLLKHYLAELRARG